MGQNDIRYLLYLISHEVYKLRELVNQ